MHWDLSTFCSGNPEKGWPMGAGRADRYKSCVPQSLGKLPILPGVVSVSKSTRLATIGLLGAMLAPSLCSAQLIIFHENWHGFGSKKVERPATRSRSQRPATFQRSLSEPAQRSVPKPAHRTVREIAQRSVSETAHERVRVAEHQFQSSELGEPVVHELPDDGLQLVMPTIPYDVIESPFRQPHREETLHFRSARHPPITHREGPRTESAVVSGASQVPVWKTPFSYGYFGARGTKHWHWHHGYRDRRSEWMYR